MGRFGRRRGGKSKWGGKKSFSMAGFGRYASLPALPSMDLWRDISALLPDVFQVPTSQPSIAEVDLVSDDDDDTDQDILYGVIRGDIVGVRYYGGSVNNKEMVSLIREPRNKYDPNAMRVDNVIGEQVGHIKKELAKALASIVDNNLARVEGVVPHGQNNTFSIPVDINVWGKKEQRNTVVKKLNDNKFFLSLPDKEVVRSKSLPGDGAVPGPSQGYPSAYKPNRTYLSPSAMEDQLNGLFENLEEGDKTSEMEPCQAISTKLYPHQKQALNWMVKRENGDKLPPFWKESSKGVFFNSVTVFSTKTRPQSVCGGILADDMGLGKTLEVIALILSNYKSGDPLAMPVPGKPRQSKVLKKQRMRLYRVVNKKDYEETVSDTSLGQYKGALPKEIKFRLKPVSPTSSHSETENKSELKLKIKGVVKDPSPDICELKQEEEVFVLDEIPAEKSGGKPKLAVKRKMSKPKHKEDVIVLDGESETDEENQEPGCVNVMLSKEDPEYQPAVQQCQPEEIPSPNVKSRPRRSTRKPAKYADSIEEENIVPKKKAKRNASIDTLPEENGSVKSESSGNGKGKSRGKGKGKGKGKKTIALEKSQSAPPCLTLTDTSNVTLLRDDDPPLPSVPGISLLDMELPDIEPQEIKSEKPGLNPNAQEFVPGKPYKPTAGSSTETSVANSDLGDLDEDFLPDLDTNFKSEDPVESIDPVATNCDPSTGRTRGIGPRTTLIVCPLSVMSNWLDQLEEHVHENVHLDICMYYGTNRVTKTSVLEEKDVVLTTYQTIGADWSKGNRKSPLQKVHWLRIILDEGHTIRNPKAKQTEAICSLKAERKWVLTGTPIQNSMKDLWSLINFLNVNPFTDRQWWVRTIERPLGQGDASALKRVQNLMGSLAMRRMKTQEVLGKPIIDLPPKKVYMEHVKLSEEERTVYETMQKEGKIIVNRYFKQGTLLHHYGAVLAILMRLRQICCHPFLLKKAAKAAAEVIEEHNETGKDTTPEELRKNLVEKILEVLASGSDEECSICLDGLKNAVITHCAHVFCRQCIEPVINGATAPCPLCRTDISKDKLVEVPPEGAEESKEDDYITSTSWQSSAKVDALMRGLINVRKEDPSLKSIVISQFTSFLTVLETPLRDNGFKCVRLDGSMSSKQRIAAMESFADPDPSSPTIFLLSLKAGGVGLNLVAASRVFLMDPAWNPASEEQAFDRCHRLGQTREVIVTKFIVEDSVEGRMLDLQEKKRALMKGAFGKKKQTAEERRQTRINDLKTLMDL